MTQEIIERIIKKYGITHYALSILVAKLVKEVDSGKRLIQLEPYLAKDKLTTYEIILTEIDLGYHKIYINNKTVDANKYNDLINAS